MIMGMVIIKVDEYMWIVSCDSMNLYNDFGCDVGFFDYLNVWCYRVCFNGCVVVGLDIDINV